MAKEVERIKQLKQYGKRVQAKLIEIKQTRGGRKKKIKIFCIFQDSDGKTYKCRLNSNQDNISTDAIATVFIDKMDPSNYYIDF